MDNQQHCSTSFLCPFLSLSSSYDKLALALWICLVVSHLPALGQALSSAWDVLHPWLSLVNLTFLSRFGSSVISSVKSSSCSPAHGAINVFCLSVLQISFVEDKDFGSRKSDLIASGNSHGPWAQCLEHHGTVEQKSAPSLGELSLQQVIGWNSWG